LQQEGEFCIREPNLIGQLGEIISTYILRGLYPNHGIYRSNTYPYYHLDPVIDGRGDFEIVDGQETILVEVKTTIKKTFKISGSGNRKYFKKELDLYRKHKDVKKVVVLRLSLVDFPKVKYAVEEL
jgi:hypothetical protein